MEKKKKKAAVALDWRTQREKVRVLPFPRLAKRRCFVRERATDVEQQQALLERRQRRLERTQKKRSKAREK